jgi:hypothetical protein
VVDEIRAEWGPKGRVFLVPMLLGAAGIVRGLFAGEHLGVAFLAVVAVAFTSELVRSRVVVTEDEVIIVRALWSRRLPRCRVASLSRTGTYPSRVHLEGEGGWGIMLPFSGVEPTERLAAVLGVPLEHREA